MNPEILFLKYAFPCSFVLQQRGEINQDMFEYLERAVTQNEPVPQVVLEKIYFRAFSRIKALARELGQSEYFTEDMIRRYFTIRHNELLDGKLTTNKDKGLDIDPKAPPVLKQLCKVHTAEIIEAGSDFYVVQFGEKKRPVSRKLVPDASIGDKVTIHYGYAVERVV